MQQTTFRAMGSEIQALLDAEAPGTVPALTLVPDWFESWEQQLSRFRVDSELSRLNSSQGRPVMVSQELWEVVALALEAARQSQGLVTPTLLDALEGAGYDRSFDVLLKSADGQAKHDPGQPVALVMDTDPGNAVIRDHQRRSIRLAGGVRLDLGGVAKGWAAHLAARRLSVHGPALVDAGGDIAISGPRETGEPWTISVANPFLPEQDLQSLIVNSGGVATSGRDYRRWQRGGRWNHHILDPRTGRPAVTDVVSATVVAPTTSQAEVAAKVALILGSDDGLAWLEARPELAGLLVLEDGWLLRSSRLTAYEPTVEAQG
jgi:thiamine biosynthesis lipoprotein